MPRRLIHVNPETLIAGPDPIRGRTCLTLLDGAGLAQLTVPDRKSEIEAVQESGSFDLERRLAQFRAVMRVNNQDVMIGLDHGDTFLIGRIAGMAFDTTLKEILTPPPTL